MNDTSSDSRAPEATPHGAPPTLRHRLQRMTGRDPHERHRAATPLELLFDLAFVVAFGQAGEQMSHSLAVGHVGPAIGGFAFAMFAICWAWINFSWFSSAYDTDDWIFRVLTMVQMIGVVVVALGMPQLFHSLEEGHTIDNSVVVAGYVIMRLALVLQWLRAARQDPARRRTALRYVYVISVAQVGWIVVAVLHMQLLPTILASAVLYAIELAGPILAERSSGGTPWHPHHIAERYGLLAIIALGEGVFGTITTVSAVIQENGWSADAVIVVTAGIGLTFALWWSYFTVPAGEVLSRRRDKAWVWGYTHILIFAAIAATGAGLHVAAYVIEGEATIGSTGAVVATAVPVLVFCLALFSIYTYLVGAVDPFHLVVVTATVLVLVAAVLLAVAGVSLAVCLLVVTLAPCVIVVSYETIGHRHTSRALDRVLA